VQSSGCSFPNLKQLACDIALQPLPIHASYRTDPSSLAVETVIKSAFAFIDEPGGNAGTGKARAIALTVLSSKKSMT
jgi:hypothetical protein